jgi:hypothetical protein
MFGSVFGAMRSPHSLVGLDLRRRYWAPLCRVSAPQLLLVVGGSCRNRYNRRYDGCNTIPRGQQGLGWR